jgi:hypothetical protein
MRCEDVTLPYWDIRAPIPDVLIGFSTVEALVGCSITRRSGFGTTDAESILWTELGRWMSPLNQASDFKILLVGRLLGIECCGHFSCSRGLREPNRCAAARRTAEDVAWRRIAGQKIQQLEIDVRIHRTGA